ncbi:MAG: ABC transporter ATP-binding protein [Erysipelotrichales bacterium]
MKQLVSYLSRYKKEVFSSLILVFISSITALIVPRMLETVINEGIAAPGGPNQEVMEHLGLVMILVAVVGLVAGVICVFIVAHLSQNVGADMRKDGFKQVQEFSYQDIEKFKAQNLVVRLTNDINQIQTVIGLMFTTLFRAPVLLIGAFFLAMTTIPQLWYVIVLLFVLVLAILLFVMSKMMPSFGKFQKILDKLNGIVKENFVGARVVKSFVTEENERDKFDVENEKLAKINQRIGSYFSIVIPALMLIVNLICALAIYLAADLGVEDPSVLGSIVSYINYLTQIMMALIVGGMVMIQFTRALVSIKRFDEIMQTTPSIKYRESGIEQIYGDIEFRNVSFTYPDAPHPSLENINLKIEHGEKIGIIGATGAGKSTLVHLLLRLFDVSEGEILIDGNNIREIPKNVLRDDVSIVLQKPILFSGTIQDNLINGSDINIEEVKEAAKNAQASEFIEKISSSYHANVNQRGSNFSGGQKQRLSIARGLAKNPPILILDDSTSALDAKSERLVKDALYTKYKKQTILIIAQKITSIIEADRIIVLDEGKLVGYDTHENLLNNNKYYQDIYQTQRGRD